MSVDAATKRMRHDPLTPAQRSYAMAQVKAKDTSTEMRVRSLVHQMGYRFRLHRGDLPGKPDLAFPSRRKVIFVHGCFWHGHHCRAGRKRPKSNEDYWLPKLQRNAARDQQDRVRLRRMGWTSLVIWECEVAKIEALRRKVVRFLEAREA